MLRVVDGNILDAEVEALVNTVNTVGVMGKGIALQFRKAFPEMFKAYEQACKAGLIEPGRMHVYDRGVMFNPRYIINFPTKRHWRGKSQISDIETGLRALVEEIVRRNIKSIAIPPLGCGHGGLEWTEVFPLIKTALAHVADLEAFVYAPRGAPAPEEMVNRTARPKMNPTRAAVLRVLSEYCILGFELSLLEIQKLLYFLQTAGEPLRLRFEQGVYGPYADNLRHVLHLFEGHFITGFGDGRNNPRTPIRLHPEAVSEAVIEGERTASQEQRARWQRVSRLIDGFQSPYGMELLSSVHWVATHHSASDLDVNAMVDSIHSWNNRKRRIMKPEHIRLAMDRLKNEGWLPDIAPGSTQQLSNSASHLQGPTAAL